MKALIIIFLTFAVFGGVALVGYKMFVQPQIALKNEKAAPPTPPPPDPTVRSSTNAWPFGRTVRWSKPAMRFTEFIDHYPQSTKLEDAKNILGEINTDIFLSTIAAPEKEIYTVQKNDVISRVATKLKTTGELIVRANNLQGPMLRIGQKLSVSPAEFSLVISRKNDKVTVLNKGKFFKQYQVLEWPPQHAKKVTTAKVTPSEKKVGRVTDKISWLNGTRVTYMERATSIPRTGFRSISPAVPCTPWPTIIPHRNLRAAAFVSRPMHSTSWMPCSPKETP